MLSALCAIIPICFAYRRSRSGGGFEVNHVSLFSFGFIFYWMLPVLAGPFVGEQTGQTWSALFDAVEHLQAYEWTALLSYCAFALGDVLAARLFRPGQGDNRQIHPTALFFPVPILCVAALASIALYHTLLFQPYDLDVDAARARGNLAASIVILGSIALLYYSEHEQEKLSRLVKSRYVLPFLLGCLFLLLIGSRLYVMSFVLMFLVYRSCFIQPLSLKMLLSAAFGVGFLSGLVGILRLGDAGTSIWVNLIIEPLFTSFSLLYFLSFDKIPLIAFPKYLFSDLVNLIPTALFPNKAELVSFPYVYNPLGALHSFVSCAVNFGSIGTVLFMFCIPVVLRWVRAHDNSPLARTSYSMLSGWFAFSFFRDPFAVSLVKTMLEFSIIVPWAIVIVGRHMMATAQNSSELSSDHLN